MNRSKYLFLALILIIIITSIFGIYIVTSPKPVQKRPKAEVIPLPTGISKTALSFKVNETPKVGETFYLRVLADAQSKNLYGFNLIITYPANSIDPLSKENSFFAPSPPSPIIIYPTINGDNSVTITGASPGQIINGELFNIKMVRKTSEAITFSFKPDSKFRLTEGNIIYSPTMADYTLPAVLGPSITVTPTVEPTKPAPTVTVEPTKPVPTEFPLETPTLTCIPVAGVGIKWTWNIVDKAKGYSIRIANNDKFNPLSKSLWGNEVSKYFILEGSLMSYNYDEGTSGTTYYGHVVAGIDENKLETWSAWSETKSCIMPALGPTVTIEPSKTAILIFGIRMPNIVSTVKTIDNVLIKANDIVAKDKNGNSTLTRNTSIAPDYFTGEIILDQGGAYDIYVKKENVTIGRKFTGINLTLGQTLDCVLQTTNCGTLPDSKKDDRTLLSGDAKDDNIIDIVDLATVGENDGKTTGADVNLDNTVNIIDLAIVGENDGKIGD